MYQTPIIKVACPIPVTLFQQLPHKIRHDKRKMEYEEYRKKSGPHEIVFKQG